MIFKHKQDRKFNLPNVTMISSPWKNSLILVATGGLESLPGRLNHHRILLNIMQRQDVISSIQIIAGENLNVVIISFSERRVWKANLTILLLQTKKDEERTVRKSRAVVLFAAVFIANMSKKQNFSATHLAKQQRSKIVCDPYAS